MSSYIQQFLSNTGSSPLLLLTAVAALTIAGHVALRWWLRRRAHREERREAAPESRRRWLAGLLLGVVPPLAFLIWTHGLYVIVLLLLGQAGDRSWVPVAQAAVRWAYVVAVLGALMWLLSRAGRSIEVLLRTMASRSEAAWDDLLLPLTGKAIRAALPLLALILGVPLLPISDDLVSVVRNGTSLLLIGLVAYVLYQVVDAAATFILTRHRIDAADNLKARSVYTQVMVLKKVAVTIIAIFTLASMLMVFESVRQFGASILASAGIASLVVGLAAQRSIATMLAGFQIAITQPIRVDDVVIVSGEWGRIEDITLTYVVVRIWDMRRLIVPITFFIEEPFQNWTRSSADILGTAFISVDYQMPMDALRTELDRILASSPYWDGKVKVLQVTDATEQTVQVRALASAADASLAWDLRCEIREKLIRFVQEAYPHCLPKLRLDGLTSQAESSSAPLHR